jgi:hypothetical protein
MAAIRRLVYALGFRPRQGTALFSPSRAFIAEFAAIHSPSAKSSASAAFARSWFIAGLLDALDQADVWEK